MVLDSASLRPVLKTAGEGVSTFTNYQGARYHPEAVRAIAEEPSVIDTFSLSVAAMASSGGGLLLDFQELSPVDLPRLIELVRGIGNAHRKQSGSPFGVLVPAGDTLAYPATLLARVADFVVIRLGIEHRPGTPPGPLATPQFIRRELGARATGLGATRLGAELPLYGYMWNRNGSARMITYREANTLVLREASSFRRDQASQFLTASGRDGWTIWIPDAQTVRTMIDAAQSRGVNIIALTGLSGADPLVARGAVFKR
jgi:spore germination protein